jgi:threonine dehydrogenase-like Zn-dependent dehydrogenase
MRAVTIVPGKPGSLRLDDVPAPRAGRSELLGGDYGEAPQGEERLVIGHESLGRVLEAPRGSTFSAGDWVVGIVRHPDPVPCANCAVGEWDMCTNGRHTEHGIRGLHVFLREAFPIEETMCVKVEPALGLAAVLLEPATILAKAWEHVERIGRRARWEPKRVLVTGAGPVGLLAAMMGVQRGLEVHVRDRNDAGIKPDLVRALGAKYFLKEGEEEYDVAIECTGAPVVIADAVRRLAPDGICCLTGLSPAPSEVTLGVAPWNQDMVLKNQVVFGSVNANRRHYQAAADALARADRGWLDRLLTRKVPLRDFEKAYERRKGDVKTVILVED